MTFACTLESALALQWVAEPFITRGGNLPQRVTLAFSDVGMNRTVEFDGVTFIAVLTQSDRIQGSTLYTLQSTLSTTASTTTNGTVIECINVFTGVSDTSVLQLQGQCCILRLISNTYYNLCKYIL